MIDTSESSGPSTTGSAPAGGFKKGGFKSSFATVKGPVAPINPAKKNVLGDDEEDDQCEITEKTKAQPRHAKNTDIEVHVESDTDEDYRDISPSRGYYDPRKPTGCFAGCSGTKSVMTIST